MVGKGRNKFSFLASAVFLFWFILLSLYFSSLNSDKGRAVLVDTFDLESDGNSNEMETEETEDAGKSTENLKSLEEAKASNLTTESTPDEEIRLTENVARSTNKALGEGSPELSGDAVHDKENGTGKVLDTIPEQGRPVAEVGHEVTTNPGGDGQVQPGMEDGDEGVVSNPGPDLGKSCSGRFIYVHDLPSQFNEDLLKHCRSLDQWRNMCPFVSNFGLGPRLRDSSKLFSNTGWFETNQFTLEIIFHNRMKQYKCLTNDSSVASAIFVPYYAGLDVARYLWNSSYLMRDHYSESLVKWISERPEWRRMWGRDHFLVAGRISWDFLRLAEGNSDWGNKLLRLPQSRNMTILTTESSPWNNNDFAIPYPTYFHPSSDNEVLRWQKRMRRIKRRYLFSFVGGRRPNITDSIRGEIIDQCHAARKKCRFLECSLGPTKCHSPENVMKMFQGSSFCLQPPGDSYTRRSTFDSILAGCIPVFFHPGSAYVQYLWHLPRDYNKYSVFIPENQVKERKASIERILSRIPTAKLLAMRKQVINLIPGVVYADPTSQLQTLKDAFDITINGVLERIEGFRRDIREGKNVFDDSGEEFTWKKNLFGKVEKHEWDSFFNRP